MRKWLSLLMLGVLFAFPALASAQSAISLSKLQVQLWPEYDQPSMLVIFDFTVSKNTSLPAQISFRLPKEANVTAVAFDQGGNLVNGKFDPPTRGGDWQVLKITVDAVTAYHFEYYQPIIINGNTREFTYRLPIEYAIESFNVKVQEPVDVTSISSDPTLEKTQDNGVNLYISKPVSLAAGGEFSLKLQYQKTTNALTVPSTPVQTAPIDESASGRISLTGYLPYILGGLGIVLIVGGLLYYFLSGRERGQKRRRRTRANSEPESVSSVVHCHQCGSRAHPNDRFCRICGSRLRLEE